MNKFSLMRMILEQTGVNQDRIALEWVSAAEAPIFVEKIRAFTDRIRSLGPLSAGEGRDRERLMRKIQAARMCMEGLRFRMAFAKQAREAKKNNTYGEFPDPEKLKASLDNEITMNEVLLCLKDKKRSATELAAILDITPERVEQAIDACKKSKMIVDP